MEDIGLHPKPTNDPPVHRPTVTETCGLNHMSPALFNTTAINGGPTMDEAEAAQKSCRVTDPSAWKQSQQKQLRMEGKAYESEFVTKQRWGPRCSSRACKKASNRLCSVIDEEARKKVFDEFWQRMNWAQPEGSTRKKPRVSKPLTWKQNRQKPLRMEGEAFVSRRKKDGASVTKAQRTVGQTCSSNACKRASNRFCAEFSEEARHELFTSFWQGMNWAQRKIYVSGLVRWKEPGRPVKPPSTRS